MCIENPIPNHGASYLRTPPRRQRGVTLIVAVVLLLLLTVIVLLATNVGVQEQRTSANDYRAKMAHYAAEAGLNVGGEYIKQNVGQLRDDARWEPCPNDDSFPCGVFPNAAALNLQRYIGDLPLAPLGPISAGSQIDAGNFDANVRVGAVICRIIDDPTAPGSTCTSDLAADGSTVLSIVSRAQVAGEGSSATLVQSITSFSKLLTSTGQPPITASGTVDVTGSLDVVTSPNAGGVGVPVSVWTRRDVKKGGSPNTCYLDEFVRFGAKNNAPAEFCGPGSDPPCSTLTTDLLLCDDCSCPAGENSLSFQRAGNTCDEGIDILDIDVAGNKCGINEDVVPSEFPCDLFEFVFGVKARDDLDGDFFCETLISVDHDGDPATPEIGQDELWLRDNANVIVVANPDTTRDPRERGCAFLNANATGLVWVRPGAGCNVGNQVGSPERPVLLVWDGPAGFNAGFRLFGLLFVRALGITDAAGVNTISPDPTQGNLGGNASLRFNGRAVVYGAAVTQGIIEKANGTAAFINNEAVLRNLANAPELQAFGTMPGAWTDRFSY